ncbi:AMN1-like protein [Mya arenaria]|uniref:AMN1-like protein n=1 Tax=Mya arenaria TaxID=6604 RepID=A0ABY7EH24_MYAAR|nr:AMN1-like protein [Mya arenaria]
MSAMVALKVSDIVFGTVSTLLDRCIQILVINWQSYVDEMVELPPNLKDRFIYLMSKRGLLNDDNLGKVLHSKVRTLDLSDCDLSDRGLQAICQCTHLQKIDLNASKESRTNITSDDVAIETVSRSCPQLRLLNIGGCNNITDRSLQALGQNCKFLKSVNLSNTQEIHINGCQGVTDEAVEAVMQFCPQINILIFHGCPNITEQSRQALEDLTLSRSSPMKQVTWTIY